MEAIIQSFFLFFQHPVQFTASWTQNRDGIQSSLFPLVVIYLIFLILTGLSTFINGFSQRYQQKKLFRSYVHYLLTYPLFYLLSFTGIMYYAFAYVQGYRVDLVDAAFFYFTLSMLVSWLGTFLSAGVLISLSLVLLGIFILNPLFSNSILDIRKKSNGTYEFGGILATGIVGGVAIGILVCVVIWLHLIRNAILGICTFYDFSWLFWLFATATHWVLPIVLQAFLGYFLRISRA